MNLGSSLTGGSHGGYVGCFGLGSVISMSGSQHTMIQIDSTLTVE